MTHHIYILTEVLVPEKQVETWPFYSYAEVKAAFTRRVTVLLEGRAETEFLAALLNSLITYAVDPDVLFSVAAAIFDKYLSHDTILIWELIPIKTVEQEAA